MAIIQQEAKEDNSYKFKFLFLRVRNPEHIIFEGEVKAVSSVNEKGPFDVLPAHGNFISIIKDKITIYFEDKKTRDIPIDKAVMKVFGNRISIFVGLENIKG